MRNVWGDGFRSLAVYRFLILDLFWIMIAFMFVWEVVWLREIKKTGPRH